MSSIFRCTDYDTHLFFYLQYERQGKSSNYKIFYRENPQKEANY